MMTRLLGAVRMAGLITLVAVGALFVWLVSIVPLRHRGAPLCSWVAVYFARAALAILNVSVICDAREQIATHHGFIFPNHNSYLDAVVLVALAPVRFVADKRIENNPFARRFGRALEVVFVDLFDKDARTEARGVIADSAEFPPIVLFPEGAIYPGTDIHPLRYGAFDIAIRAGHAVLPTLIRYEPHDLIYWSIHEGSIVASLWRVACDRGRKTAHVTLLPSFTPTVADEPVSLSERVHASMQGAQRALDALVR